MNRNDALCKIAASYGDYVNAGLGAMTMGSPLCQRGFEMVTGSRKTWKDFTLRDSAQCMQKRGGQIAEELDFILKGIKENGISMSEGVRASAIAALSAALVGGGIGAAIGARKNKKGKRRIGKGALIGALLGLGTGAVAGPAYAQLRKYLDGVPFNNDKFNKSDHSR
jgi:hypothetical protein